MSTSRPRYSRQCHYGQARWDPSVSKNPYLAFKLKGGANGDKISVTWVDNKGETRTDEATIS